MSRTTSELRASNIISPILTEAVQKRTFETTDPDPLVRRQQRADHLARLRQYMPLGGKPIPEVEERDVKVGVRDGHEVRVRVYTSREEGGDVDAGPLILMFHEGGFTAGDLTDEEMNCRLFCREFGAVCVNVEYRYVSSYYNQTRISSQIVCVIGTETGNVYKHGVPPEDRMLIRTYRLAPEAFFPTWIHDSIDVTRYFAVNARSYNADPSKGFIVGGNSAGGNIAAVLAQLSRLGEIEPPITGQYLSVPLIFPLELVPEKYRDELLSPYENLQDPILKDVGAERLKDLERQLGVDPSSNLFTPLGFPSYPPDAARSKYPLARAYMQVAGLDPLRDHALVYDRILRVEYGVRSKVDLYSGFGHMFWTNWPELRESHDFVEDTVRGTGWLLGR